MLKSIKKESFSYKKLTPEEMSARGILGYLDGPCADIQNETRNGRRYSEELWTKVFESPLVQEQFEAGGIFGELTHPDREEVDMEKIAIIMPEPPAKGEDGLLFGHWDILDTPCGRILKTLCDYGYKVGISTRGSGETFTDYDGKEAVDPDSYTLNALDIVLIPAVKAARLNYMAESLDTKKSLKESLQDIVNKASDNEKKVMEETLDDLGMKLDEQLNFVAKPFNYTLQYNGDSTDVSCAVVVIPNGLRVGGDTMDAAIHCLDENGEELQFGTVEEAQEWIDNFGEEVKLVTGRSNIYAVPTNLDPDIIYDLDESLTEARHAGYKYKFGIHAFPNGRDIILGGSQTLEGAEQIAINQVDKLLENPWMSDKEKFHYMDTIYIADDDEEVEVDAPNFDDYVDRVMSEIDSGANESLNEKLNPYDLDLVLKKMKAYLEEWEEVHDKDYSEAWVTPEEIKNLEKVASYLHIIENEKPDLLEDIENSDVSLDIDEVTDDSAVVDDEAIFEELQTVLKQRQEAEQKVIELNEKLSVCYAKEESVNNRVTSLKAQIEKLTESSNQVAALKTKVSKLKEDLNLKEQELEKLNKRISTGVNARKALTEDVSSKQDTITKLNEELKTSSNTIQSLTTQVEDLKKDLQLNKNSYSKKLEKSNKLVENYKKITTNVINRYIESQALKLGISSNEIKNKLPESYNIDDIDSICEDLQSYKLNMSKLPFSTMQSVKVTPKSINAESLLPKGAEDDFVDAQLLSLLEKK